MMSNKSYILKSVIAGMAVRAAVNQKKREKGTTAQLLRDPVGSSIRINDSWWNTENIQQYTCQLQH